MTSTGSQQLASEGAALALMTSKVTTDDYAAREPCPQQCMPRGSETLVSSLGLVVLVVIVPSVVFYFTH